jgi:hypothetical protein
MNITGANKIELLKKGKKQILLIGDYHHHYKKDGCSFLSLKKTMLVPEFIEKIIKTHDDKKWDFYFEQGVIRIDGAPAYNFLNKIKDSPSNSLIKDSAKEYKKYVSLWNKNEISLLGLTNIYFSMIGCIPKTKKCPENLRLHFIDIRQKYFGDCEIGKVHYHRNFYDNLFDAFDNEDFETFIDNIIDSYNHLITNCLPTQTKVKNQVFKSEVPDKVMDFFEKKISGIMDLMSEVLEILEKGRSKIIELFKEDLKNETILAGEYILAECKKIDAFNRIERIDEGFESFRKLDFLWEVMFVYIVTIMDMYALGRMTKRYNENIIVLAGMNHILRYRDFFIEEGWKSEWIAKQPYKKCSEVPLSIFLKGVAGKTKKRRITKKKKKN